MFRKIAIAAALLIIPGLPQRLFCQQDKAIEKAFIGTWRQENFDCSYKAHVVIICPVEIVVSVNPEGGLILDYTYGVKGTKYGVKDTKVYDKERRYIKFLPAKDTVLLRWADNPHEVYHANGLSDFAANGAGTIDLVNTNSGGFRRERGVQS